MVHHTNFWSLHTSKFDFYFYSNQNLVFNQLCPLMKQNEKEMCYNMTKYCCLAHQTVKFIHQLKSVNDNYLKVTKFRWIGECQVLPANG